MMLLKCYWRKC